MYKSAPRTKGFSLIILLVVVLFATGAIVYILRGSVLKSDETHSTTLPPKNERINPEPLAGDNLFVDKVDPGTRVLVKELKLQKDGYLVVTQDTVSGRVEVGRSKLLSAGNHRNVSLKTQSLKDGDVIYVGIVTKNGNQVVDANNNVVEVQKNVGMVMSHYKDEY